MHPEVRRYYDEAFDQINNEGASGLATRVFHRAVERPFTANTRFARVLELGAAHGEHVKYVRHSFDEYVLSDLEDHEIQPARLSSQIHAGAGLRGLSFEVADATALPFTDNSFDRTVHTCLLHHLPDPETALREMRRVLRNGGVASIYLPCDPGLLYTLTQRLTTGREIRRILREGRYQISPEYLRAQEHPNHYSALLATVREVFRGDDLLRSSYPFNFESFHFSYFSVFHARVAKTGAGESGNRADKN